MAYGKTKTPESKAMCAYRSSLYKKARRRHPRAPKPWAWDHGVLRDACGHELERVPANFALALRGKKDAKSKNKHPDRKGRPSWRRKHAMRAGSAIPSRQLPHGAKPPNPSIIVKAEMAQHGMASVPADGFTAKGSARSRGR